MRGGGTHKPELRKEPEGKTDHIKSGSWGAHIILRLVPYKFITGANDL